MSETRRPRAAIWLLTLVAIAASAAFAVMRVAGTGDGAAVAFYADAWRDDGAVVRLLPGPPTDLRPGDVVTAVGGRPLAAWIDGAVDPGLDRAALDRAPVTYTVLREGSRIEVPVTLAPHDTGGLLLEYWSALLLTGVLQAVAAYVLWRRPGASAAAALAIVAVGVSGSTVPWLLGLQVSDIVRGWPLVLYGATAGGLYMLLWPAGALHLPLAMTATEAPRRRTLAAAYAIPMGAYVAAMVATRIAAPTSVAWMGAWGVVQGVIIVPTALVGLGLAIARYRSAPPLVRSQVAWVVIAAAVSIVLSLALLFGPQLVTGRPLVPWSAVGLITLPLPVGIALAILRRRLFDIDVVINRALVYGGATAVIAVVYVATVTVLSRVLGLNAGLEGSLLATGLAAVVALPVRDGLQQIVNRLMYGDRDDPYRALIRLGRRLEGTLDPMEAPPVIVSTIAESLRLPWVSLRIGRDDRPGSTFTHGHGRPTEPVRIPVVYGAETVGDLAVAPRSPAEPLGDADHKLLADLARQVGPAIHALALAVDLAASRERLVAAREEERRRIRRDLHDGLGPTLAGIGMRAEVAAGLAGRDPEAAARVLDELREEVRTSIADIRRLVDDLRPPAIDELGLPGALRAQVGHLGTPPVIDVATDGPLPALPAAVEVAAFRIAVEAMTNAARHSGASACRVRIALVTDGDRQLLEVDVSDDGHGLPDPPRPGIGLVSMRERAAEVGGTLSAGAGAGGGTRVLARLPLGPGVRQDPPDG